MANASNAFTLAAASLFTATIATSAMADVIFFSPPVGGGMVNPGITASTSWVLDGVTLAITPVQPATGSTYFKQRDGAEVLVADRVFGVNDGVARFDQWHVGRSIEIAFDHHVTLQGIKLLTISGTAARNWNDGNTLTYSVNGGSQTTITYDENVNKTEIPLNLDLTVGDVVRFTNTGGGANPEYRGVGFSVVIPEPASIALLGPGVILMAMRRRKN